MGTTVTQRAVDAEYLSHTGLMQDERRRSILELVLAAALLVASFAVCRYASNVLCPESSNTVPDWCPWGYESMPVTRGIEYLVPFAAVLAVLLVIRRQGEHVSMTAATVPLVVLALFWVMDEFDFYGIALRGSIAVLGIACSAAVLAGIDRPSRGFTFASIALWLFCGLLACCNYFSFWFYADVSIFLWVLVCAALAVLCLVSLGVRESAFAPFGFFAVIAALMLVQADWRFPHLLTDPFSWLADRAADFASLASGTYQSYIAAHSPLTDVMVGISPFAALGVWLMLLASAMLVVHATRTISATAGTMEDRVTLRLLGTFFAAKLGVGTLCFLLSVFSSSCLPLGAAGTIELLMVAAIGFFAWRCLSCENPR